MRSLIYNIIQKIFNKSRISRLETENKALRQLMEGMTNRLHELEKEKQKQEETQ